MDEVTYEVARPGRLADDQPARGAQRAQQGRPRRLWSGFRRFADDDSAAVLILTGAGEKAFCAGGDLKEMAGAEMKVPPPDFLPYLQRTLKIDKPVIAAVNGVAFAGGFLLAQMVDLVHRRRAREVRDHRGPGRPRRAVGGAAAVADPAAGGDGAARHRRADRRGAARTSWGS